MHIPALGAELTALTQEQAVNDGGGGGGCGRCCLQARETIRTTTIGRRLPQVELLPGGEDENDKSPNPVRLTCRRYCADDSKMPIDQPVYT